MAFSLSDKTCNSIHFKFLSLFLAYSYTKSINFEAIPNLQYYFNTNIIIKCKKYSPFLLSSDSSSSQQHKPATVTPLKSTNLAYFLCFTGKL